MKKTIPLVLLIVLFTFCSQEKKLLRQAANSVERSNYEQALSYYDEILKKDQNSFFGNAGKGVVLSEFMGRHEQAIPYLENALKNTPDKTKPILHSNLGKSYHFMGNYERALFFYSKSQKDNDPKWADYDEFLTKRIADCKFAIEHPKVAVPENQHIVNLGSPINTEFPEYTPVLVGNKMYYTSKRQDSPKEKRNGIDGKYFEAIYVSELNPDGTFGQPQRYTIPHSNKGGEAVMSASPDGKKLFIYRGGKIYETNLNSNTHEAEKLSEEINFAALQNHASLSPDGKTMYFTSDSEDGRGGTDIYVSTRKDDGSWSTAKRLDMTINTTYDEDAPFVDESGTLFFSSNGHPGYGGFDVYKSKYVNGSWTKPENLGQPINSPGDDIYFVLHPNSSKGYYSSARPGGRGDLDLYKVHYVNQETTPCVRDEQLTISSTPEPGNNMTQKVQVNVPESYKGDVRAYRWEINGQPLAETGSSFNYTFPKGDTYIINAQLTVYCDSCPQLQTKCSQLQVDVENPKVLTQVQDDENPNLIVPNKKGKKNPVKKGDPGRKDKGNGKGTIASNNSINNNDLANGNSGKAASGPAAGEADKTNVISRENSNLAGPGADIYLSETDLRAYNWNTSPELFALDQYEVTESCKTILDQNANSLKSNSNLRVVIVGHADSRGSDAYNKVLSYKRANAVKQYLISKGVEKNRIKAVKGMGESELLNNCDDNTDCSEEQHQLNRRVTVYVIGSNKNTTITLK